MPALPSARRRDGVSAPAWTALVISLVALVGLSVACAKAPASTPAEAPSRIVDFYLRGSTLRSLGEHASQTDASAERLPAESEKVVSWTFTAPDGRELASGVTADTRSATSEFGEDGVAAPLEVPLSWMMFSLRLPSVEGTVSLFDSPPASVPVPERAMDSVLTPRALHVGRLLASFGLGPTGAECSREQKTCETDAECTTAGCPRMCVNGRCASECDGAGTGNHVCTDGVFACFGKGGSPDGDWSCAGSPNGGTRCCDLDRGRNAGPPTGTLSDFAANGTNIQNIRPATGPCAVNILMVPEAYSSQAAFRQRAAKLADQIRGDKDWAKAASSLAFWTADFYSSDDQVTDPDTKVTRSTAFGAAFGVDGRRRALAITSLPPDTAKALAAAVRQTNADLVMLLVNTGQWGGAASSVLGVRYVTVADNASQLDVIGHEMGHALLHLKDEYAYAAEGGYCDLASAEGPNTSAHLHSLPWQSLVDQPVPTPSGTKGVGAFEGAAYCPTGVYRPTHTCRMRETGEGFCPVCTLEMQKTFGLPAPRSGGTSLIERTSTLTCGKRGPALP
jgi:hypothetical protein